MFLPKGQIRISYWPFNYYFILFLKKISNLVVKFWCSTVVLPTHLYISLRKFLFHTSTDSTDCTNIINVRDILLIYAYNECLCSTLLHAAPKKTLCDSPSTKEKKLPIIQFKMAAVGWIGFFTIEGMLNWKLSYW